MLKITNLHVSVDGKAVLKGINLEVNPGQVHVIMGPNGSGKSTLASVLTGKPGFETIKGSISFLKEDLLTLSPEERAQKGLFLAFQYPVEIPGVTTTNFLKEALNQIREANALPQLNAVNFLKLLKEKMPLVGMTQELLSRSLNVGFSGGEKKRNEIFQMAILEPKLAVLDETDSGLDIDALKIIGEGIQNLRTSEKAYIIITHYPRILKYVIPDIVHVLHQGKITKSGNAELAKELEQKGYDWLNN